MLKMDTNGTIIPPNDIKYLLIVKKKRKKRKVLRFPCAVQS